jgi:hypothetical protein
VIQMMRKGQVRWVSGTDIGVRISSSTRCSSWPPEILTATLAGPSPTGRLEVATLPEKLLEKERKSTLHGTSPGAGSSVCGNNTTKATAATRGLVEKIAGRAPGRLP